jgi:pimeloyl-ACP methyl ester carboxylesterase
MWLTLLLAPVLIYLIIAAILFFAQTALIFPGANVAPAGPPPPGTERLELAAAAGHVLRGVHIPPTERSSAPSLLIIGFAGNASNAADAAEFLHGMFPEADVAAFHYRGYMPSTGETGASALQEDALLVHDFLRARLHPGRTVAVGMSIGSGVAAYLAGHRPLDGLILVTPFDSLAALSADHYPWLPVRVLLRHSMEPIEDLRASRVPVAILSGGVDTTVPPARTEALRRALSNLVFSRTFPRSGHNDIYDDPGFRPAIREALDQVLLPGDIM